MIHPLQDIYIHINKNNKINEKIKLSHLIAYVGIFFCCYYYYYYYYHRTLFREELTFPFYLLKLHLKILISV